MKEKWSSLIKMWLVVAVLLSQTVTAEHLSDVAGVTVTPAAVADGEDNMTVDDVDHTVRGSCWLRAEPGGRCSGLYALNVTRAECCALRPGSRSISYATGWTRVLNMTSRQYFYWIIVGHGVPGCEACRSSCEGFRCSGGLNKVCRMRHGQPRCVCAADCVTLLNSSASHGRSGVARLRRLRSLDAVLAATWHGPVCSFDGRTHRNLCALAKFNCRLGRHLPVEYIGPCQSSCENVTCPGGKHCAHDQNGVPHCIHCRTNCRPSSPSELVCGGDGQTYSSLCALQRHTCLTGRPIRLAYRGNCQPGLTCSQLRCGDGERCLLNTASQTPVCFPCDRPCVSTSRRAVCGNDGRTYASRCDLERAACRRGVVLDASHAGRCVAGETTADTTDG